jgi:hypothetical protein
MHDKSTKVRGFIEHKSKGCVVEDFAVVINVFRMSHMASRAPRFCHELTHVRFVTKIPLWEGGKRSGGSNPACAERLTLRVRNCESSGAERL